MKFYVCILSKLRTLRVTPHPTWCCRVPVKRTESDVVSVGKFWFAQNDTREAKWTLSSRIMTVYFRNAGYRSWKCEISRAGDISNITLPKGGFSSPVYLLTCTVLLGVTCESLVWISCSYWALFGTYTTLFVDVLTRFTSVRVSAKYHGIKLEYREHRHTVLDLLGQIRTKLRVWKRPYISPEAVRVLLQEWHVGSPRSDLASLE